MSVIQTLPPELSKLWADNLTTELDNNITNAVNTIVRATSGLTDTSLDEIIDTWSSQAHNALSAASLFLSVSNLNKEDEDEWKAGIMSQLVSYWICSDVVARLTKCLPPHETAPPARALGEDIEHYRQRLIQYAKCL